MTRNVGRATCVLTVDACNTLDQRPPAPRIVDTDGRSLALWRHAVSVRRRHEKRRRLAPAAFQFSCAAYPSPGPAVELSSVFSLDATAKRGATSERHCFIVKARCCPVFVPCIPGEPPRTRRRGGRAPGPRDRTYQRRGPRRPLKGSVSLRAVICRLSNTLP